MGWYFNRKPDCSNLFNDEDKARLAYKTDIAFRKFVNEWNIEDGATLAFTTGDFYRIYKAGYYQPELSLI